MTCSLFLWFLFGHILHSSTHSERGANVIGELDFLKIFSVNVSSSKVIVNCNNVVSINKIRS